MTQFTAVTERKCKFCGHQLYDAQDEHMVHVPIAQGERNIARLLDAQFHWSHMLDSNCSSCGKREGIKRKLAYKTLATYSLFT